jgi:hypothetical protein
VILEETVVTVEFRDGERDIPMYLFRLMAGMTTYALTYDDAVAEVNTKIAADQANRMMNKVIREHFRMNR